ncbi:MAG TPA: hypothetical protein VFG65_02065 [Fimbriimonadales bacterium]|jgi:hypothetical protein|nr:hypothetical protein [Fimbriimonadales bacterium]
MPQGVTRENVDVKLEKGVIAWALGLILAVCLSIGTMSNPAVRYWLADRQARTVLLPPDLTNDPKIGSKFPLPAKDAQGKLIDLRGKTLVVFAGTCGECSAKIIEPTEFRGDFENQVLIYDAPRKLIPKRLLGRRQTIIVADETGSIALAMNAVWAPRFYLLDQRGILRDLQIDPNHIPTFVSVERRK